MKIINRLMNKIIYYFKDSNVPLDFKNLYIIAFINISICIGLIFASSVGTANKADIYMAVALILFFITLSYMLIRFREIAILKYIVIIIVNFFIFPMLYFLNGDIYSGAVMFFALGIISTFFLSLEKIVYLVVGLLTLWYGFIIYISYINNDKYAVYRKTDGAGWGLALAFFAAALVPIIVIIYQTTIFNKVEASLRKAGKLKDEAYYNKSRFLTNMTQEIRIPMNSIVSMNELLLREELDTESRELVENINLASGQLLKVINNVLEFSKLESARMELMPQKYDFRGMITEIINTVSVEYASEDNEFYINIDPNIPMTLFGDKGRIRQVFLYILFSAVNKMPHNRISLSIKGDINRNTNTVLFSCAIAESGLGLSESEIEAMLSSYNKFDSRQKSEYAGMGLELSICKEILNLMGGTLSINSVEGVGMAVHFEFINYIIDDSPIVKVSSFEDYNILIYCKNDLDRIIWDNILSSLQLYPNFVDGPNAFRKALEDKKFTHIFIDDVFYGLLKDTISEAELEESVYILAEAGNIFSDFGTCKIIRKPLNCINVSSVLNNTWKAENYRIAAQKEKVIYPNARILIVDDSIVNLKVLDGMVSTFEITTKTCKSGKEALDILNKEVFDMLILDQRMPEMDGIELLHLVKGLDNINSKVPVLCATADFGPDIENTLKQEGFSDYLAKPVRRHYLERMLRRYLPIELAVNVKVYEEDNDKSSKQAGGENNSRDEEAKSATLQSNTTEDAGVIHYEIGMNNVGGSVEAFNEVLLSYHKEGMKKLDSVPQMFPNELALYVIEVHALKSSSAAIGATALSELFKELEYAGRANNTEFVEAHSQHAFDEFKKVLDILKDYMITNGILVEDAGDDLSQLEEMILTESEIGEIIDALASFNLKKSEEALKELTTKNYGKEMNARIKSIWDSYEMFDYHKVRDELSLLRDYIL